MNILADDWRSKYHQIDEADKPLATICTVSSNICQFAALQLGWKTSFEDRRWINLDLPLTHSWTGVEHTIIVKSLKLESLHIIYKKNKLIKTNSFFIKLRLSGYMECIQSNPQQAHVPDTAIPQTPPAFPGGDSGSPPKKKKKTHQKGVVVWNLEDDIDSNPGWTSLKELLRKDLIERE
ncbi:uncharacterized protein MELLADRAFT_86646 [Melampsora larici-populina 98AG31]|uniref:Uncharacterized protein n=1 Tax=Melampsora larici-populina (strain 98AG31 / pathotype 3-4-7) TaxID=747676 RepID=F4RMI7_MELLP|nr:uncharacterized protein MELLADRAFT_86646 [Melampsora larici-populina 98AG31]EGG06463.1 hypothetical protein MELLADRAFT_86646 [Melampsora larici-populina 98AG31]